MHKNQKFLSVTFNNHFIGYPTPLNISYFWGFGFLSAVILAFYVLTVASAESAIGLAQKNIWYFIPLFSSFFFYCFCYFVFLFFKFESYRFLAQENIWYFIPFFSRFFFYCFCYFVFWFFKFESYRFLAQENNWYYVDVVWLFLFVSIYWWENSVITNK